VGFGSGCAGWQVNSWSFKKGINMNLSECRIIDLPKILDNRGNLTFIEANKHVPFEIKRVYYLYDVPGGATRGGHAHKHLQQFIIAAMGSFDVILDDGSERKRFHLNRSYYGLYIPTMIWRELDNFSSGSVCLALVSELYDEDDYIRDYDAFRVIVRGRSANESG
jgi:dTDP-4-dehydrorhamnose 3,5-epimerase-like enzyme